MSGRFRDGDYGYKPRCPDCGSDNPTLRFDVVRPGDQTAGMMICDNAWHAAPVAASPAPPAGPGVAEIEAFNRLMAWVRERQSGGCKMFSLGDACLCPLCDIDRLRRGAASLTEPPPEKRACNCGMTTRCTYPNCKTEGATPPSDAPTRHGFREEDIVVSNGSVVVPISTYVAGQREVLSEISFPLDALLRAIAGAVRAGSPPSAELERLRQIENDYRALAMCIGADPDMPADAVFEVALNLWREMKEISERRSGSGGTDAARLDAMQDGFVTGFVAAACNYDRQRSHAADETGCDTCKEYAAAAREHIDYPKTVTLSAGQRRNHLNSEAK